MDILLKPSCYIFYHFCLDENKLFYLMFCFLFLMSEDKISSKMCFWKQKHFCNPYALLHQTNTCRGYSPARIVSLPDLRDSFLSCPFPVSVECCSVDWRPGTTDLGDVMADARPRDILSVFLICSSIIPFVGFAICHALPGDSLFLLIVWWDLLPIFESQILDQNRR